MPRQKTYCYFAVRIVGFVLALHTQCAWYRAKIYTWKRMDDSYIFMRNDNSTDVQCHCRTLASSEDREPGFFTPTLSWHLSKWDVGVIFALLDSGRWLRCSSSFDQCANNNNDSGRGVAPSPNIEGQFFMERKWPVACRRIYASRFWTRKTALSLFSLHKIRSMFFNFVLRVTE